MVKVMLQMRDAPEAVRLLNLYCQEAVQFTKDLQKQQAQRMSHEAMRLGSRDPQFLYHAGAIAADAGDAAAARALLGGLLAQSPRFNPLLAPRAERILRGLG